jgi:hypothetical protein
MRHLLVCVFVAVLLASCAPRVPGYRRASPSCLVPSSVKGMHRVRPSAAEVNAVWAVLDLKQGEYIHFWFEDDDGKALIGITNGANNWEVELFASGDTYTVNDADWRRLEPICVG